MGTAIGIDLGTSNSAAAIYRRGRVESIAIDGKKVLPSVVSYRDMASPLVGQSAKSRLYIDPENSVASSKRHMGTDKTYSIQQKTLKPLDVATEILRKIKVEASKSLNEPVTAAVITVPAYYTERQREDTKLAAEKAGFQVLRLLPEPTAAAIAYGLEKERNQTIMVYDLGGGTFDVSILKVEHNSFRVLAVDGNSQLGGDDFDEKIIQLIGEKSGLHIGGMNGVNGAIALQRLKEEAEEIKKQLSEMEIVDVSIPDIYDRHIDIEISRSEFEASIRPLLNETITKMNDVLKAAKLTKNDISRVILVGGSSRTPAVQQIVKQQIKQPFIADNVDEIVAQGAAILAANMFAPDQDNAPIEVTDVTAHSFGTAMYDQNDIYKIYHLIEKNTTLPCRGATVGYTRFPNQKAVSLGVYRQEDLKPNEDNKLGEINLNVTVQPDAVPALALFEIDSDGILTFSSAELTPYSRLHLDYRENDEIDLDLLDTMIKTKELIPETIIIDTSARGK